MGARFAVGGGRQGWTRSVLTAVGVGLGVAMLLLASSVPTLSEEHGHRTQAREAVQNYEEKQPAPSDHSVLTQDANNRYRGEELYGRLLQPEGSVPPLPPGVQRMPEPGEMVVSPALERLLESDHGKELGQRLDARVVGTIGDEGLLGPAELAFYKGTDQLEPGADASIRTESFGTPETDREQDATLLLLVVVACAVLLMPIAVFIATAVRFGGERRDRRLAAIRLVGADGATTRRMAAGESLVGALLGLLLGGWFFLLGRVFIGKVSLFGLSVFPSDVTPGPALATLIVVAVPVAAVLVSLFALRGIVIEPLGVMRESTPRPRRLWWRLLPPVLGLLLLLPLAGSVTRTDTSIGELQVVAGVALLLSGVAVLLPWVVELLVRRLRGGPVSWQLAVRRLQLNSGNATRAVTGITIAVAGAIALQLLLSSVEQLQTRPTGQNPAPAELTVWGAPGTAQQAGELDKELARTKGVRSATVYAGAYAELKGSKSEEGTGMVVAECATLRKLARIPDCREGGSYFAAGPGAELRQPRPGEVFDLQSEAEQAPGGKGGGDRLWRVPRGVEKVRAAEVPDGVDPWGLLVTPSALGKSAPPPAYYEGWMHLEPGDGEALERARTAVFQANPAISLTQSRATVTSGEFQGVQRGILAAAVGVLLLIGASMAVTTLEQLRERKRQLSVLVAFGVQRRTLAWSVFWQTAIPVALGMVLAVVFGLGLGRALLALISRPVADWFVFLPITGVGLALIALVTLLSLPSLWRVMRSEGLRTE
ncbi:ABC transporter permease [Streptomyces sp. HNM0574]|nr:ABC transporter permease [Streptomyces sp. HNM0574]NLU66622.1 ABC transporter permease [Streptomyces sp. HNM0574]